MQYRDMTANVSVATLAVKHVHDLVGATASAGASCRSSSRQSPPEATIASVQLLTRSGSSSCMQHVHREMLPTGETGTCGERRTGAQGGPTHL